MPIIKINSSNFDQEVLNSPNTILIDFFAEWCAPCKRMSEILDEIISKTPDINIGKINIDEEPNLATKYGVSSIPTLLLIKNGHIKQTSVGLHSKDYIIQMLNK